ncbi:hypothetical protein ID866_8132 [Astraeus odoratus]|nr:hypothetical protein ID866_8132 [Astraeus odoratus]
MLDINPKGVHFTYTEWGKIYGDIVYARIFSQEFIIVNSEKAARDLADKRSTIYSDRPHSPIYRIFGIDHMTPLVRYGNEWRTHRKLLHISLHHGVVDRYQDLYLSNAHRLLANMQNDGARFYEHFDMYAGAISLEFTYGRKVERKDDPVLILAAKLVHQMTLTVTPQMAGLLMALPMLEHIPSWFPGAKFMKEARQCRKLVMQVSDVPFAMSKKEIESGGLQSCFVSDILAHGGVEESEAKEAAAGVYMAAMETTATTLKTFVLCMLLFPEIQDKIHAELDAVVGRGVLPTFEDKIRLPYLQAVLYEVMRWRPVTPLGAPHATTSSDVFEGYYIPKGAIVIFNAWAMRNKEDSDPECFDPTRHLTIDGQLKPEAEQNNSKYFGFGRRICPGRFFSANALWAAIATMLSALRFEKAKDSFGNVIDVEPIFDHGTVRFSQ